jgi:hypothetical protein
MNNLDVADPTPGAAHRDGDAATRRVGSAARPASAGRRFQVWWHTQHPDAGQATAEYALVLLGAAMVALILIGWATGSGAGRVGGLLDRVIDAITGSF